MDMKNKIRKVLGWLLLALLATGTVAGCGMDPAAPIAVQEQQATGTSQGDVFGQAGESQAGNQEEGAKTGYLQEDGATPDPETESEKEESLAEGGTKDGEAASENAGESLSSGEGGTGEGIREDGAYTGKDQVALYLHTYGRLPGNYITKKEAQDLGWDNKKGNLDAVAPGKSIGGSRFGNYEGLLPEKPGRNYYECDLGYEGGYRGAKRLVYSNDGLIFYTEDHYKTFEQLY